MRILLIMDPGIPVPPTRYGGHERLVYLFAEEYHRLGHDVTLFAGPGSHCSGKTICFGINVLTRTGFTRLKEIIFVWRFLFKNKQEFDLVHNFGRLIYLIPVLNCPVNKIMSYGRRITHSGIKIMNALPNKNIIYTGCSDYCVNTGNIAGKWKTVYNSINFDNYKLQEFVADDAPIIFLSRLDKIKGADIAIRIALKTGNKLILAGNMPATPDNISYYNSSIKPFIDQKQIIYVGEVNDDQKNHWLGQAKAMLFPLSGDEAFGLVMIEAMACGTPVIAFNHAAAPEVIDQNQSGYIAGSEKEMAEYLEKIPLINRSKCRALAQRRFDVKVITAQYLELFDTKG